MPHQGIVNEAASAESFPGVAMLDVRQLAAGLSLPPIELVQLLQADGVPMLQLSPKRWRLSPPAWRAWLEAREAKAAQDAQQRRLRMQHAAGATTAAPANRPKVKFRR